MKVSHLLLLTVAIIAALTLTVRADDIEVASAPCMGGDNVQTTIPEALDAYPPTDIVLQYQQLFYQNMQYSQTDAIIAARSKSNPNYFYDWVRDSALAMGAVEATQGNSTAIMGWYERFERFTQAQFRSPPNPGFDIRSDVKFEVNGNVYTGPWGRGQNDGPAARVAVRINYAQKLIQQGNREWVISNLYRPDMAWGSIKWELDWVKNHWSDPTFDIWEECNGYHFYTLMLSRKALYKGAVLAYMLNDFDYALELLFQAANINKGIPQHFDERTGMIFPMINTVCQDDRQSMDIVVQLATLYGNIDKALMNDVQGITKAWYGSMCPGSDQRCATMKSYIDNWEQYGNSWWVQPRPYDGRTLFSLWNLSKWSKNNFAISSQTASSLIENVIARYAWDRYDGTGVSQGNPWILSSFSTSQIWNRAGQYFRPNAVVDKYDQTYVFLPTHLYMWEDIITQVGSSSCSEFQTLLNTLRSGSIYAPQKSQWQRCAGVLRDYFFKRADDAVMVPFQYLGYANNLTEQIQRNTGLGVGAPYLTWSFSSFIYADTDRNNRNSEPL